MEDKRIPARALIECLLCGRCGKYSTATGGGICEACTIRAELAAARLEIEALRVKPWQEQIEGQSAVISRLRYEKGVAEAEAAALRTHVERLREKVEQFLNEIRICPCGCEHNEQADGVCLGSMTQRQYFELEAVRAATPAQSLAKCKAEALEAAANKFEAEEIESSDGPAPDNYSGGYHDGQYACVEWLIGEASRLQAEAANG